MKYIVKHSLIYALIINIGLLLFNLISAIFFKTIPLSYNMVGGEWQGKRSFGIMIEKITRLTTLDDPNHAIIHISFDFISFIITFIIILIIVFFVILIKRKIKTR